MAKIVRSELENYLLNYQPYLPDVLKQIKTLGVDECPTPIQPLMSKEDLKKFFPFTHNLSYLELKKSDKSINCKHPLKVGVFFSGGPAPGGHNVIAGLFDSLKIIHKKSSLIGFLNGGKGLLNNDYIDISKSLVSNYRNLGGFDIIGSGRKKIIDKDSLNQALTTALKHKLDGLVVIGGDGSNTNTALLAEYFSSNQNPTSVIGIPKTIDGDLKHPFLQLPFGFDSATKLYSSMIGNICRDVASSKNYYHFIKLMGRSASHITLECALQTHPNFTLIGEEIAFKNHSLDNIAEKICRVIRERAKSGKYYGVILIPEGVIEFIPEIVSLVNEIQSFSNSETEIKSLLSEKNLKLLETLPEKVAHQLLYDRDDHGNIWLSKISVDQLIMKMIKKHIEINHDNLPFNAISHFLGYEGRSGLPTKFDNDYCYSLGYCATGLIKNKKNGYLATIDKLTQPISEWKPKGIPIVSMLGLYQDPKTNQTYPLIKKNLVTMDSPAFSALNKYKQTWALTDSYCYPGPQQWNLKRPLYNTVPLTLEDNLT